MVKQKKLPEGVFLRGNIYWVRWSDGHGRKIQETTGKSDLEFAKAWVEARRTAVRQGKMPEMVAEIERKKQAKQAPVLFEQLVKKYSEDTDITGQLYWSVKKYYVAELNKLCGHMPIENLRPNLIYKAICNAKKKDGTPRAEGSNAKVFLAFSHMLKKGVEYGLCSQAIYKLACDQGIQNPTNHRTNWLRPEECQALIKASGPLLRPIIITAIMTGLRRGDILKLKWTDIDFRNGFIDVITSKTKTHVKLAINGKFKDMLENLPKYGEYVFMSGENQMFAKDFRKSYYTARRKAGIPDCIQFKDLRHTFASLLINAGMSIKIIKDSLGHGSYKMTDRYTHISNEQLQISSQILEAVFPDEELIEQQAA